MFFHFNQSHFFGVTAEDGKTVGNSIAILGLLMVQDFPGNAAPRRPVSAFEIPEWETLERFKAASGPPRHLARTSIRSGSDRAR